MTKPPKRPRTPYTIAAVAVIAVVGWIPAFGGGLMGGAQGDQAGAGLRIVPVFGPDRADISADVDWFASKAGTVESEHLDPYGEVAGFVFADTLLPLTEDGLFDLPPAWAEVGVDLRLPGRSVYARVTVPDAGAGETMVDLPVTGLGRIALTAAGFADDALVTLTLDGPQGGTSLTTGWAGLRGHLYLVPGQYRVILTADDTPTDRRAEVEVTEGQTVALDLQ